MSNGKFKIGDRVVPIFLVHINRYGIGPFTVEKCDEYYSGSYWVAIKEWNAIYQEECFELESHYLARIKENGDLWNDLDKV